MRLVASSIGARTRRLSAPSAVGEFSRCTTVPPQYRGADSSLSSPGAAAALRWCSSSWLSSHRRRWRFGAGSRIHNWMSSLGPMGGGGGHRLTYTPFLFHGLRPQLGHNGDEMQQSGQANNRIRDRCLYRGIIGGSSRPPTYEEEAQSLWPLQDVT